MKYIFLINTGRIFINTYCYVYFCEYIYFLNQFLMLTVFHKVAITFIFKLLIFVYTSLNLIKYNIGRFIWLRKLILFIHCTIFIIYSNCKHGFTHSSVQNKGSHNFVVCCWFNSFTLQSRLINTMILQLLLAVSGRFLKLRKLS